MAKIFLVEDNEAIRDAVGSYLKLDDHKVFDFPRLEGVEEAFNMQQPDLLILDVMLPDGNGFHLAKKIRSTSAVPILFLTAKVSESDRITGFEVGGDDYMIKPFSPRELCLRVKAILKRTTAVPQTAAEEWCLEEERLSIHHDSLKLLLNGEEVLLTQAEWKILTHLTANAGAVSSRERLLGICLDYTAEGSERTIDTHIKNIRAKLKNPDWIRTVRGTGYCFQGVRC